MELILDIGNSFIKCYFFENEKIIAIQKYNYSEIDLCLESISKKSKITSGIICNVSGENSFIQKISKVIPCIIFSHTTPIPIGNAYETPHTLGLDRIAAAVGAEYLMPNKNKLIIDAGTAITIDFISDKKRFEGGNISPGMESRFRALHDYTGKLPKVKAGKSISLTGKNTTEAIQNGVIQGILFEIDAYISTYNTIFPDISVFLTGGDAFYFEKMLKKPIFAELNLNAIGLHRILQYNA